MADPDGGRVEPRATLRKIMVVDDDDFVRTALIDYLVIKGHSCVAADSADTALGLLDTVDDIAVVLSDLKMPGKSGIDLLAEMKKRSRSDPEFVIMTGYGDTETAIAALRHGAFDYLLKPIELNQLIDVLRQADERYTLRRNQRDFRLGLIEEVKRKSDEARTLMERVDTLSEDSLRHLAVAAEFRDSETGAHNGRIGAYAAMLAACLGWPKTRCRQIELAAPLHDVGKIGIPDSILMKTGRLTNEEFTTIKEHCKIGGKILSASEQPMMKRAAEIATFHHERWDGTGYPEGLKCEEIPIVARIVALCDVYDALRSARPYKSGMDHNEVVRIILEGDDRTKPSQFDPNLLEIFKKNAHRFDEIFNRSIASRK